MRHGALLNGPVTGLIGDLGHSDKIMIVDAGWPIPRDLRYDLCLTHGIPRLTEVFAVIAEELSIFILPAQYKAATAFALLLLILLVRPRGLLNGKVL